MMLDFYETLKLARSMTAHRVEPSIVDCDGFDFHIGDFCTVSTYVGGPIRLVIGDAGGVHYQFGNVTAAIQAADTYETVMAAIRESAKASREKVTV